MKISHFLMLIMSMKCLYGENQNKIHLDIRMAEFSDLPKLSILNYTIAHEYFKMLYKTEYEHLDLGKNAEQSIKQELEYENRLFYSYIADQLPGKIIIACSANNPVGLIALRYYKPDTLEIELLIIDKNYRGLNIGRKLVEAGLKYFVNKYNDIKYCTVYPFNKADKKVLSFYESLGFVNCGAPQESRFTPSNASYKDIYFYYKKALP